MSKVMIVRKNARRKLNIKLPDGGRVKFPEGVDTLTVSRETADYLLSVGRFSEAEPIKPPKPPKTEETL